MKTNTAFFAILAGTACALFAGACATTDYDDYLEDREEAYEDQVDDYEDELEDRRDRLEDLYERYD